MEEMMVSTSITMVAATLALAVASTLASAQTPKVSDGVVRIGVLTDMAGPFSDISGPGAVLAIKMAVEDFGGKVLGKPIEVVAADHQNKPDIGLSKAREWIDVDHVDMIADLMNSAVALGVVKLVKDKGRIAIVNGASTSRISNEDCTPNSIHYNWDTYSIANGTARAVVKQGGKSWFFVTVDFAYGASLQQDAADAVKAAGGTVVGAVKHPLNAPDMSSFLLQAQTSTADIIALANGGGDTINSIKTANEFGISRSGKQRLVGLAINLNDTHALGLQQAQGLLLTEAFYWDMNDQTRKWSRRFFERMKKMPTSTQAADYSSTMHYLNAVKAAGTDEAQAVMNKMREIPINDFYAKKGRIRIDGRMVHEMYLAEVKKPSESKYPWDYYKILATIPGDEAFRPLTESKCYLVNEGAKK
jgi:branched-chain amino acid transport system substrate-binding protein